MLKIHTKDCRYNRRYERKADSHPLEIDFEQFLVIDYFHY